MYTLVFDSGLGEFIWVDDQSGSLTDLCPDGSPPQVGIGGGPSCSSSQIPVPIPITITVPPPAPAPLPPLPVGSRPTPIQGPVLIRPPSTPPVIAPSPPVTVAPNPSYPPPGTINLWGGPVFNPTPVPTPAPTPITSSTSTETSTTGNLAAEGPIFVNVANSVALTDNSASNAVSSVASAVNQAVQQSAQVANQTAQQTTADISGALQNLVGNIDASTQTAFSSLGSIAQGIETGVGTALGGIGQAVANSIFNSINPVDILLSQVATILTGQISSLAGKIAQAVAAVLPAIIAGVTGAVSPSTAALEGIQSVLTAGLNGLVQQSTSIADSLGNIGMTLDTVLSHYELWYQGFTENQTGYPQNGNLHDDLSAIWKALAGLTLSLPGQATVKISDLITSTCFGVDFGKLYDWAADFDDPKYGIFSSFIKALWSWFLSVVKVVPAALKIWEDYKIRLNQDCPLDVLSPGQLVDAVLRGFLTQSQAQAEAAKGNLNESRFAVMQSLATHQFTEEQLVESRYRSIIPDSDMISALKAQGYTDSQVAVARALGVALLSVPDLQELSRRGLIDAPTLDTALAAHQYDDAQRKALATLTFRPPRMNEAIEGGAALDSLTQLGLGQTVEPAAIPEYVSAAAAAEGLDVDATNQRWFGHWNLGPLGAWIQLYFRGVATLAQVQAVAIKQYIPNQLLTTLIESSRPLIQFRTIANMLRGGQLTVQQAGDLLLQHGYTPANAQLLINYAQRPGTNKAAQAAKALHAVSLGIAKREYIDGAISENDYYQILLQHGYTIEGANAEIAVENANQAMLVRKENAQLVIDEYGSGLINEQTALAQLAGFGLTVYELAKYTHKLRVFRVKNGKHPSETDLNHFLQDGIIDAPTYEAQLIAQGYSVQASGWFLQYRQKPTAPAAAPVAPAPATGP